MVDYKEAPRDPCASTGGLAGRTRRRMWLDDQRTVNDLQDSSLLDIDPDALREAEKVFAQGILDTMSGKQVAKATYEDTRVVVIMSDGSEYYFYGFMGESRA